MTVSALVNIEKLCKIQNEANELLQTAMLDERGQNWKKVCKCGPVFPMLFTYASHIFYVR